MQTNIFKLKMTYIYTHMKPALVQDDMNSASVQAMNLIKCSYTTIPWKQLDVNMASTCMFEVGQTCDSEWKAEYDFRLGLTTPRPLLKLY